MQKPWGQVKSQVSNCAYAPTLCYPPQKGESESEEEKERIPPTLGSEESEVEEVVRPSHYKIVLGRGGRSPKGNL